MAVDHYVVGPENGFVVENGYRWLVPGPIGEDVGVCRGSGRGNWRAAKNIGCGVGTGDSTGGRHFVQWEGEDEIAFHAIILDNIVNFKDTVRVLQPQPA